jgi:hypothetical protein
MKLRAISKWILALLLSSSTQLRCQSNTFPSSGNAGIGTISPATKLELIGDNEEISFGRGTFDLTPYSRIGMTTNYDTYWASNATFSGTAWNFVATGGWGGLATRIDQYDGAILFDTISGGTNPIAWNNRLYIANSGNIGIGTTIPQTLVDVYTGGMDFRVNTYTTEEMVNTTGGYARSFVIGNLGRTTSQSAVFGAYGTGAQDAIEFAYFGVMDATSGPTGYQSNKLIAVNSLGYVGIGTTNPMQALSVNGTIEAKEVIVQSGWSDYVFDKAYRLKPLSEVEAVIKAEHHLPGIPTASQVATKGVGLGEMEAKLLAKIEELTLRQIDEEKRIHALELSNQQLRDGGSR